MLSRDCDGCPQIQVCSIRYKKVPVGGKVYCLDGTAHLVDEDSAPSSKDAFYQNIELFH